MSPKDQNLLATLNLLTLLLGANKQKLPKLSEVDQHTLRITTEHLSGANISLPVFINTLQTLHKKGYLIAVSIYEKEFHEAMRESALAENQELLLKALEENGLTEIPLKQKVMIADAFEKMATPGSKFQMDREGFYSESISFKALLEETLQLRENHKDTDVSTVLLMPFRSIDKLLEKMNEGKSFNEIQDSSIWYDPQKCEFHIGEDIIETAYQGKKNISHYVLERFSPDTDEAVINYDEITEFKPSQIAQAMRDFTKKDPRLKDIFSVYSTYLEINTEYLEQTS